MDFLNSEIRFLKGVGEKRAQQLNKLGVYTIYDLFYFFPRKYIDYSNPYEISFAPYDQPCVVKAVVLKNNGGVRIKGGKTLFKVICGDDTAKLTLTYFNAEFTVKKLQVGQEYLFYGKIGGNLLSREMSTPIFIPADLKQTQQAVYPLTQGLSGTMIAKYITQAFQEVAFFPDFMPPEIVQKYQLCSLDTALRSIHQSTSPHQIETAKNRLVFDEFFILQLGIHLMGENQEKKTSVILKNAQMHCFFEGLSFSPTAAQLRVIKEILQDFAKGKAMNRLVQGDVGCGKTLVAAAAMFAMADNGYQSCMMAPTEILAIQHYETLSALFHPLGISTALLTASTPAKERKQILQRLVQGEIQTIVGTHSLLNEQVIFQNLGLCITDEQHRFGVAQRTKVAFKGNNPHILVMSATPIPRTLAMIIYGNMQISVIDEMPKDRKPIETFLVGTDKRARMFGFIQKHIKEGRQCYIVLPAIEDNENASELQSVTTYYTEVIQQFLPTVRAAILHGKMKPKEKEQIMLDFKKGDIDILCATTVVEVGVDVPNAVLMIIENAERYGLSALHQLRGRVGRGAHQSFCILVSDSKSPNAQERLKFLCSTQDGFKVSQYDLDSRGPGDFFGKRQHGLPSLKIADMSENILVLETAKHACEELLKDHNWRQKYPLLNRQLLKLFEGYIL